MQDTLIRLFGMLAFGAGAGYGLIALLWPAYIVTHWWPPNRITASKDRRVLLSVRLMGLVMLSLGVYAISHGMGGGTGRSMRDSIGSGLLATVMALFFLGAVDGLVRPGVWLAAQFGIAGPHSRWLTLGFRIVIVLVIALGAYLWVPALVSFLGSGPAR
jgi:hypothetical protein